MRSHLRDPKLGEFFPQVIGGCCTSCIIVKRRSRSLYSNEPQRLSLQQLESVCYSKYTECHALTIT